MDLMLVYDSQWFAHGEIGVRQSARMPRGSVLRRGAALSLSQDR